MADFDDDWFDDNAQLLDAICRDAEEASASRNPSATPAPAPVTQYLPAAAATAASWPPSSSTTTTSSALLSRVPTAPHASATPLPRIPAAPNVTATSPFPFPRTPAAARASTADFFSPPRELSQRAAASGYGFSPPRELSQRPAAEEDSECQIIEAMGPASTERARTVLPRDARAARQTRVKSLPRGRQVRATESKSAEEIKMQRELERVLKQMNDMVVVVGRALRILYSILQNLLTHGVKSNQRNNVIIGTNVNSNMEMESNNRLLNAPGMKNLVRSEDGLHIGNMFLPSTFWPSFFTAVLQIALKYPEESIRVDALSIVILVIWIYFCNGKLTSIVAEGKWIARKEAFCASTFFAFELPNDVEASVQWRYLLMREALILLNRLASHAMFSKPTLEVLVGSGNQCASLTIDTANRLPQRSKYPLRHLSEINPQMANDLAELAQKFRSRVYGFLEEQQHSKADR
ncbi:hypothetical protein ACQ4PT_043686 [Festuca glaucescens]